MSTSSGDEKKPKTYPPIKRDPVTGEVLCDCKKCVCEECSPAIMQQRQANGKPDECTCLSDCSCAVCAGDSKPAKGASCIGSPLTGLSRQGSCSPDHAKKGSCGDRPKHPPDCDCVDCICDPCGSSPEDYLTRKHPPDCDCKICLCEPCGESKHPADCDCADCLCDPCKVGPAASTTKHPPDCDCLSCLCDPCKGGTDKQHPPGCNCGTCKCCKCSEKAHTDGCTCTDCALTCGTAQVTKEAKEHDEDCDCVECLCEKGIPSCKKTEDLDPLGQILKKIKCVCDGTGTEVNTMSGLQAAIQCCQQKTKEKDCIIAAMLKELEIRSESKDFNKMLQQLANADSDKTPVCTILPKPKICSHPNYPNCPCGGTSTSCSPPHFPKCQCGAPPADATVQAKASFTCRHPDIPNCPCAGEKQSAALICTKGSHTCTHPDFPNCPCIGSKKETKSRKRPCPASDGSCPCPKPKKRNCRPGAEKPPRCVIVDSLPMEITDVRRISADSLIVKWTPPRSKYITGYEILVNGTVKSQVLSSTRTCAVLHSLIFNDALDITIYATTVDGKCKTPAKAIFQI